MPIYEYVCTECKRKFRKLVGVIATQTPLACPNCHSQQVNRLISRFARVRSEDETMDAMAEEMEAMGDTEDPKALRRLVRAMGKEMGEDMEDDFEQMLEEEASGGPGTESDAEDTPE